MAKQINHTTATAAVMVLDGPYREVLDLLEQARSHAERSRRNSFPRPVVSHNRTRASCEALRVTTRLSHCLAWLMVQKAIQVGELPPEAALDPERRLDGHAVCSVTDAEDDPDISDELRSLLTRSRRLFERVSRLDDRIGRMQTAGQIN
jgi:regulator of CtrA degradation